MVSGERKKVFLLPGEFHVAEKPTEIATLLGSCVAICLRNKKMNIAGMNHYMLPKAPLGDRSSGRHGDYSTNILVKTMLSYDPTPAHIEANIIGGGNVTGHLGVGKNIGASNIVAARDMLAAYNIRVVGKNVGGVYGRKVYFQSWDGAITVRRIEKSQESQALEARKKDITSRNIKVLIVDDSITIQNILKKAIESDPGVDVVGCASNPYEARECMLETNPDVICLDVIMPKMDGITFLKKLFQYKPTPVIVISTVVQEGSALRKKAKEIGAVDVIDKEDLELYKGMEHTQQILLGKIKMAANTVVSKKSQEELESI